MHGRGEEDIYASYSYTLELETNINFLCTPWPDLILAMNDCIVCVWSVGANPLLLLIELRIKEDNSPFMTLTMKSLFLKFLLESWCRGDFLKLTFCPKIFCLLSSGMSGREGYTEVIQWILFNLQPSISVISCLL